MASNQELIDNIKKIDPEYITDDLKNAELADALKKLKADAEAKAKADAEAKAKADTKPVFKVAKGKSLTSLKGILKPGDEVEPNFLPGGKETFNNLKEKGYIE